MIDPLHIVQSEAQDTAVIRFTIPREEIRNVMGAAITEVLEAAIAQGVGPTGPIFSHHFKMQPDIFDFEVGVPVSAPITPSGRVEPSSLPSLTIARTEYHGPYEELGAAWGAFREEIEAAGHVTAENLWEVYIAGPESSPDPSQWRTELNKPLVS